MCMSGFTKYVALVFYAATVINPHSSYADGVLPHFPVFMYKLFLQNLSINNQSFSCLQKSDQVEEGLRKDL